MDKTTYENCAEFVREKREKVIFKDKKSKIEYRYENDALDELSKYKVDDCLITGDCERCDFLLENYTKKYLYFIELKGSDLIKAVEQIACSLSLICKDFEGYIVHARIVLTRINITDLKNTRLIKLQKKMNEFNGELKYKSKQYIEKNNE